MGIIYYIDLTTDGDLDLPYMKSLKSVALNRNSRIGKLISRLPMLAGIGERFIKKLWREIPHIEVK